MREPHAELTPVVAPGTLCYRPRPVGAIPLRDDVPSSTPPVSSARGWLALAILFVINLANYADRWLVTALGPLIKKDFVGTTDAEIGLLTSSFIVIYMLASPFAGYLADRVQRRYVIAGAIVLWSVATALASRAPTYGWLLAARAAVGIGEAGYNAAGSALLTDLLPANKRSRALAIFNMAIPVGSALGFQLAGWLGEPLGWRNTCLFVGGPGIVLAPLALLLKGGAPGPAAGAKGRGGFAETLRAYGLLLRDPIYATNTVGLALMTFALGGLGAFTNFWLVHAHAKSPGDANFIAGAVLAGAGFVGTALGALIGDFFSGRGLVRSYALVSAAGYLLAAPLIVAGIGVPSLVPALAFLFFAMVGSFMNTGPSNAITALRAPPEHRAAAFALSTFVLHLLGDVPSPPCMGAVSDWYRAHGAPESVAYGHALALAPAALVLAAVAMAACAWTARREERER